MLQNLSLAKMDRKKLQITKAGILFFAKEPSKFIRHHEVTCVLYKGKNKEYILERKDFKANLSKCVEEAMVFFRRHLKNEYEIKELRRKELWDVPLTVLREAMLNAVIHRDYNEPGASILVDVYEDRIEISNPGSWPTSLDRSRFGKFSYRRNPVIADIFQRMDEVEKVGSGIRRMREQCKRNGNPEPIFDFEGGFFSVEFLKRKIKKGEGKHLSTTQVPLKYHSSITQVDIQGKLISFCKEPRSISAMLEHLAMKSRKHFREAYLTPLLEQKLLRMTNPKSPNSPKQTYQTTPKGLKLLG